MIERNKATGLFEVTCDQCSSEWLEVEGDNKREAARAAREEHGWYIYQDDGGAWAHACAGCGMPK